MQKSDEYLGLKQYAAPIVNLVISRGLGASRGSYGRPCSRPVRPSGAAVAELEFPLRGGVLMSIREVRGAADGHSKLSAAFTLGGRNIARKVFGLAEIDETKPLSVGQIGTLLSALKGVLAGYQRAELKLAQNN